ncbi:hypothetical protein F6455_11410 [Proteobacteria bacterium 005FR1]|nr:hypothetical protein [Proteobacteria bacterium 005FR1]
MQQWQIEPELVLTDDHFIGRGLHRECYIHPNNPDLCIKVVYNGGSEESRRERSYYAHLQRRRINWSQLPRFHGELKTSRGRGAVFDLIRDFDAQVSRTLESYLVDPKLTQQYESSLADGLMSLRTYLIEQRIITMTIKPKNILFRRSAQDKGALYIVDNIGSADFIPISNYVDALAVRKIMRKWQRFERDLLRRYPENTALRAILLRGHQQLISLPGRT